MLNTFWVMMVLGSIVWGACTGRLEAVARASTESAVAAVNIALGMVGVMTFWLGLMQVLREGGLLKSIARWLRPVMVRLFPEVPADHPAMGMMVLNMTSNILGLGNAATPFGLKAMLELNKLNAHPGVASNAMALFLAINTSGLAVLPTSMVALRASLGSTAPGSILIPTVLATFSAGLAGIVCAKLFSGWRYPLPASAGPGGSGSVETDTDAASPNLDFIEEPPLSQVASQRLRPDPRLGWGAALIVGAALVYALFQQASQASHLGWGEAFKSAASTWPLLLLIAGFILFGLIRGVKIYDAVVEGGKEGFQVTLRIIPYLVAILVAVGMLRASGAMDMITHVLAPLTRWIGMPPEALPMALLRPLTGSGAYAVATDLLKTHGPDTLIGQIVSTLMGTTETTFYVLSLYLGLVGVHYTRQTVVACLVADGVGILVAVWSCRVLLG